MATKTDHAAAAAERAAERKAAAAAAAVAAAGNGDQGDAKSPESPETGSGDQGDAKTAGPVAPVAESATEPPARMASAKEGTCGLPVMGSQGAKPCVKEPGHEGDHAIRKYKPRVDTSVIAVDALAPEAFEADEELTETDESDRSDTQKTVDAQVLAAHEAWAAGGKPATFPAAIKAGVAKRYFLEPEQADAYRTLLRAAGRLHKVRVKIAPVQTHKSGRHMLPWFVLDSRTSQAAAAAPSANGEAAVTPPATTETAKSA